MLEQSRPKCLLIEIPDNNRKNKIKFTISFLLYMLMNNFKKYYENLLNIK